MGVSLMNHANDGRTNKKPLIVMKRGSLLFRFERWKRQSIPLAERAGFEPAGGY
jgi:hypothetical protein